MVGTSILNIGLSESNNCSAEPCGERTRRLCIARKRPIVKAMGYGGLAMRRAAMLLLVGMLWIAWAWAIGAPVVLLTVNGAIGPATAGYVHHGLGHAARIQAQLVVLQ